MLTIFHFMYVLEHTDCIYIFLIILEVAQKGTELYINIIKTVISFLHKPVI